jgi:hypothetical protein
MSKQNIECTRGTKQNLEIYASQKKKWQYHPTAEKNL